MWNLHSDPSVGAQTIYQGNNHFAVVGVFIMTANYIAGEDHYIYLDSADYQATVTWDPASKTASLSKLGPDANGPTLTIPRPAPITDAAALAAVHAHFASTCTAQTGYPSSPDCPHNYRGPGFSNLTHMQYTLKNDPTSNLYANVTYNRGTGIVQVSGSYVMDATYFFNIPDETYTEEDSGNYIAYLTLDNGTVSVIDTTYQ